MSWLFSLALVEEFSAHGCLDGELCAQLKSIRTAERSYYGDKKKVSSPPSLSGTMCEPSTVSRGVEKWMSLLPASPARDTQLQGSNSASMMNVTSGQTPFALLEKSSHNGYCWKMCQISLFSGTLELYSET